jgi:hypothetical protein
MISKDNEYSLSFINILVYFGALCVIGYGIKELTEHATLYAISMFSLGFTILIPAMILTIYLKLNNIQHSILAVIDKDYNEKYPKKQELDYSINSENNEVKENGNNEDNNN